MSIFNLLDEQGNFTPPGEEQQPMAADTKMEMPEGEKTPSVFDLIEDIEPPTDKQAWWQSIPADVLKGFLEAASRVGRMMGPLQTGESESEIQRKFTERLDEMIPSDETFLGSAIRRGEQIAGPAAVMPFGGGMSGATRGMAGGLAGQTAEHLGAPEWLQTVSEIAPFFAPGMGEKIIPRAREKEAVEFLRKAGAKEKEIAPLLSTQKPVVGGKELPSKLQVLGKVAEKGSGPAKKLRATQEMLGRTYEGLRSRPEAAKPLTGEVWTNMINKVEGRLQDMPAKVRNVIMEDFQQLVGSDKSPKSIMKFYRDVSKNTGGATKELSLLKDPLKDAMKSVAPELAKDFNLTNQLYSRWADVNQKLNPKHADFFNRLIDLTEWGRVGAGIYMGNYPLIVEAIGEKAGRRLATEMITNPRLQNLSKQTITAINSQKYNIANQLRDKMIKMIKKDHPEAAAEMVKIDFKDFADIED